MPLPDPPFATGEAARLLGISEPRLADLVRRGKVTPPPPLFAGRRLWSAAHVLQAAEALGLATDELRRSLGEEVSRAG
jgi:hypothetical protein